MEHPVDLDSELDEKLRSEADSRRSVAIVSRLHNLGLGSATHTSIADHVSISHDDAEAILKSLFEPIPMLLWCPSCNTRHIDTGEFATKAHCDHACQNCGLVWRPSKHHTVGVQFLPGYKTDG